MPGYIGWRNRFLGIECWAGILKSLWGLGTEEEEGYRTGPPGYIGWRNSFLRIDSGAPYTFKNTGSGLLIRLWVGEYFSGNFSTPVRGLWVGEYCIFMVINFTLSWTKHSYQNTSENQHGVTSAILWLLLFTKIRPDLVHSIYTLREMHYHDIRDLSWAWFSRESQAKALPRPERRKR
jgi:hypothetical protein